MFLESQKKLMGNVGMHLVLLVLRKGFTKRREVMSMVGKG